MKRIIAWLDPFKLTDWVFERARGAWAVLWLIVILFVLNMLLDKTLPKNLYQLIYHVVAMIIGFGYVCYGQFEGIKEPWLKKMKVFIPLQAAIALIAYWKMHDNLVCLAIALIVQLLVMVMANYHYKIWGRRSL